jgi:hypothetical protein
LSPKAAVRAEPSFLDQLRAGDRAAPLTFQAALAGVQK